MGGVQSLLSMGAMILLTLVSLRFNSTMLSSQTADLESKVYLTAISLGDNIIEEAKTKAFDISTINFPTTNPATLTAPGGLGPAYGETYPNFNDFDDFNNFHETIQAPYLETYYISCVVTYVQPNNPDQVSSTQTFYKRLTVTVTSPFLKQPNKIILSYISTLK